MEYPPLEEVVKGIWPSDVIARAKELREDIGSVGAYSHSKGVPLIRKSVAQFIEGNLPPTYLPLSHHVLPNFPLLYVILRLHSFLT